MPQRIRPAATSPMQEASTVRNPTHGQTMADFAFSTVFADGDSNSPTAGVNGGNWPRAAAGSGDRDHAGKARPARTTGAPSARHQGRTGAARSSRFEARRYAGPGRSGRPRWLCAPRDRGIVGRLDRALQHPEHPRDIHHDDGPRRFEVADHRALAVGPSASATHSGNRRPSIRCSKFLIIAAP